MGGTAHLAQWKSHDLVLRYKSRSRHLKMGIDYTNNFLFFSNERLSNSTTRYPKLPAGARENQSRSLGTTTNEGTRVFTPDVVYLRWVNIDTKVLGTLLFIVVCLTRRNERHLVIF